MIFDQIRPGMDVRGPRGEKLGRVVAANGDQLLLEKGFLAPRDYLVRGDQLATVTPTQVQLRVGLDRLEPWDASSFQEAPAELGGTTELKLHEEELVPEKQLRVRGQVLVRKRVVTEQRTLTVDVRREVLAFETLPAPPGTAQRGAEPNPDAVRLSTGTPLVPGTFEIPLYEEEVRVVTEPRVKELVRVRKDLRHERRTFGGTVRREDADVEATGRVRVEAPPDQVRH